MKKKHAMKRDLLNQQTETVMAKISHVVTEIIQADEQGRETDSMPWFYAQAIRDPETNEHLFTVMPNVGNWDVKKYHVVRPRTGERVGEPWESLEAAGYYALACAIEED